MSNSNKIWLVLIGVVVFGIIYATISLTQNVGKPRSVVDMESSSKKLDDLYNQINVKTLNLQRGEINTDEVKLSILPDISEYPFVVNPSTENFITIYATPRNSRRGCKWFFN